MVQPWYGLGTEKVGFVLHLPVDAATLIFTPVFFVKFDRKQYLSKIFKHADKI